MEEETKLDSWEEFLAEVAFLRRGLHSPPVFSGQQDGSWSLSTTLERTRSRMLFSDYYHIIARLRPQIESLIGHEWQIPEYPEIEKLVGDYEEFKLLLWSGRCPAYAYMAHLRHHGFPSPLLNWTRSPYAAAFFAIRRCFLRLQRSAGRQRTCIYLRISRPIRRATVQGERERHTTGVPATAPM